MATKWQRVAIEIPRQYGPAEREAIAQEIVEFIRNRTAQNRDKNNRQFAAYSESYVGSFPFKVAGKSRGDVNLVLSGDMMSAMDALSHKPGRVVIGFQNGTVENAKADGNIRGTYGTPRPIPGKARDFLGISKRDLKEEVLSQFPLQEVPRGTSRTRAEAARAAAEAEIDFTIEGDLGE